MKDIGSRLRELRTNQGLTQQRVAELTGLARTNIVKHEQNKMKPRPHHLEKYAKVYNTTISDILGENECYTIGDYFDEYFRSYSRDLSEEEKKAIARKLVEILTKYAEGETTYNGYDSYQLLRQFLYITDPKNPRKITEYNNINKLVSVVNGNVVIGNQAISIGDRQSLISKIASMNCVINHEDLNINFND